MVFQLKDKETIYHRYGPNAHDNVKWVSPKGYMEAVYDRHGDLVTDALNMGTFNYAPPTDYLAHIVKDVAPYYFKGNTENDPTEFLQRDMKIPEYFLGLPRNYFRTKPKKQ